MSDRWVQVQGAPTTLTFTVHDLYSSAAVCVANRGTAPERVSVTVGVKATATPEEAEEASHFAMLADQLGSGTPGRTSVTSAPLGVAYAIVPPDTTIVAAVISPRGLARQLPSALLVQVFASLPDTTVAATTLTEAESSSREIEQWLRHRKVAGSPCMSRSVTADGCCGPDTRPGWRPLIRHGSSRSCSRRRRFAPGAKP